MAELLYREQKFLKRNEQLNDYTMNTLEEHEKYLSGLYNVSGNTNETHRLKTVEKHCFSTYTKRKGPSTLLKTQAVDKILNKHDEKSGTGRRDKNVVDSPYLFNRNENYTIMSPSSSSGRQEPNYEIWETSNSDTFTVKYHNPNYSSSSSHELLANEAQRTTTSNTTTTRKCPRHHEKDMLKKTCSPDSLVKYFKSKIALLEADHTEVWNKMSHQQEQFDHLLADYHKVEEQRNQAYLKCDNLKVQIAKTEAKLEENNRYLSDRVAEKTAQMKELEKVQRDKKILEQTNVSLEKQLHRISEELQNAKVANGCLKANERELKEVMRIECENKDKHINRLKKQRMDLLNAYKKQIFLIDNLKKQNICVEQSKLFSFSDKEFTKVLEWNALN